MSMGWARARGYRLHVWTADDPDIMRELIQNGVDIIITNHINERLIHTRLLQIKGLFFID